MSLKRTIGFGLLAIAAPLLYDRYYTISTLYNNSPAKFTSFSAIDPYEVKFKDQLRNCEDIILIGDGLALLSCDEGRDLYNTVMGTFETGEVTNGKLFLYNYGEKELSEKEALKELKFVNFDGESTFHPLGIEFHKPTSTLYAINHDPSGPFIELFYLSVAASTITHVRTISHPLIHAPNSLAIISPSKLYVTNWHYFLPKNSFILTQIESYLGFPISNVAVLDLVADTAKVVATLPFANGLHFINSTTLAVASTSKPGIYLYSVDPATMDLTWRQTVRVPAFIDNLSVDGNGKLLIAGHAFPPGVAKVAKSRKLCNSKEGQGAPICAVKAPSWVGEWSEENGLRELYRGTDFMSSSTAVRDSDRKVGFVSGLYERGILAWKE